MQPSLSVSQFEAFRADGWPLCPECGEDELYSLATPATIETIAGCYRCPWVPRRIAVPDYRGGGLMGRRP